MAGFPHAARILGIAALVALLLMTLGPGAAAAAPQAAPATWHVVIGGEAGVEPVEQGPVPRWTFMRFYPAAITIDVGDTIHWTLATTELHTVSFLAPGQALPAFEVPEGGGGQRMLINPQVAFPAGGPRYDGTAYANSGQLDKGGQAPTDYSLTFTEAGTYPYLCIVHTHPGADGKPEGMLGVVTVQPAGAPYPQTQAQIDAAAAAQLATDTRMATQAEPAATQVTTAPGPNGTTMYNVNVGYGDMMMDYMRFAPSELTIAQGDTVVFTQRAPGAPHTVTFASGGAEPDLVLPEPQPGGPPKLVLNPAVLNPAGGRVYSGTGYFNSGWLNGATTPAPGPRSYALTFDTPGRFAYYCVLHDDQGMVAHITVQARAAMPGLPNTGGGGAGRPPLSPDAHAKAMALVLALVSARARSSRTTEGSAARRRTA